MLTATDSLDYEFKIARPDGEIRYIHQNVEISRHDDSITAIFGTMQDITERKRNEETIRNIAKFQMKIPIPFYG